MYVEGFGEEEFVKLDGTEFDSPQDAAEPTPSVGHDPLDKALAGAVRRRATKAQ